MKFKKFIRYALLGTGGALFILVTAAAVPAFRSGRAMEILVNMFRELQLYYVDDTDPDRLLSDAAAGMVRSLDPYTEYISEEDMAEFEQMTTGKYAGIGSQIEQEGDYVVFSEPYKGSPADRAGIKIGDRIIEIEGKSARGVTPREVSERLRGEPGTSVRLKVEKFYTGGTEDLKIRREIISRPGVPFHGMVNDSVGYIAHTDFTEDCANDMRNAVMELKGRGAKGLIIDYRGNGGGIMQEAVKILSLFVPKGTQVVEMRGRSAETSAAFLTQSEPIDAQIPIVVIVDGGSASAAEIVSGAMQDLDRAVVMGWRTYGKGLVQATHPLGYNSYLKLTTAKYYLPSGRCIQAIDYARRGADGSISFVPDSLVNGFATRAGRKVFDGGGVMPDSLLSARYASRFTYLLYGLGYISEFAGEYSKANRDREIIPGEFALTDEEYAGFTAYMEGKDVVWESETQQALRLLREKARQERYLDGMEDKLDAIAESLNDDKRSSLQLYREDITELLENEIILRHAYAEGVSEHNFRRDDAVIGAAGLLAQPERYSAILAPGDTEREERLQ